MIESGQPGQAHATLIPKFQDGAKPLAGSQQRPLTHLDCSLTWAWQEPDCTFSRRSYLARDREILAHLEPFGLDEVP